MNYQLIIVIAIMVLPALKQIYDKVQERAEVEKRKRDQSRARTETLRTGRPAPTEQPSRRPRTEASVQPQTTERTRLQQLEAERERRLRELRRIAQQRAQTTGATQRPSPPAQQPQQQRRIQQRPAVLRPQQTQGRQASVRRPSPPPTQRVTRPRPAPATQPRQTDAPAGLGAPVGAFEGQTTSATRRRQTGSALGRLGLSDLRRAVILSEVLGKPVALRQDHLFTGSDTA
jgi:hypothetical protein